MHLAGQVLTELSPVFSELDHSGRKTLDVDQVEGRNVHAWEEGKNACRLREKTQASCDGILHCLKPYMNTEEGRGGEGEGRGGEGGEGGEERGGEGRGGEGRGGEGRGGEGRGGEGRGGEGRGGEGRGGEGRERGWRNSFVTQSYAFRKYRTAGSPISWSPA